MANPTNKWSQPAAPPAPMFFGKKERDLVKQVNDELAERVIGQPVAYYPISIEESNFNDIYGESIDKVSLPPVRIFAYVVVENEQSNERYGYEYQTKLTVNFNRKRLVDDQNLYVRVGDFVQYGTEFYEIVRTYNDTRYYFGQVQHKFQVSAECIRARKDAFRVIPGITRPTDTALLPDGSTAAAPRPAPYPPLDASYVVINSSSKLPSERVLTAGSGVTITDAGRNNTVTITASGRPSVGPTGSLQFASSAPSFSGSANLLFLTGSNLLQLTGTLSTLGSLTASVNISASAFFGDGSGITNLPAAAISSYTNTGNNRVITSVDASSVQGEANFTFDGSTLTIVGDLTASANVSASAYYGDGSTLTGIATSGGIFTTIDGSNAYVTSSLNIGSTATPTYTLDVAGDAGFNEYLYHNGDGDTYIRFATNLVNVVAGGWSAIKLEKSTGKIQLNNGNQDLDLQVMADDGNVILHTDAGTNRVGIGTTSPTHVLTTIGSTHLSGGLVHNRTGITAATYTLLLTDYYIGVDTTSNPVTLTLPAASTATAGQTFVIKDEGAAVGTNAITVEGGGSDTIDGLTSFTITSPYGSIGLYTDGSNWFIY